MSPPVLQVIGGVVGAWAATFLIGQKMMKVCVTDTGKKTFSTIFKHFRPGFFLSPENVLSASFRVATSG